MPIVNLESLALLPAGPAVPELDILCHREVILKHILFASVRLYVAMCIRVCACACVRISLVN